MRTCERNGRWWRSLAGLVWVILLLTMPEILAAREKKPKPIKVSGLVTEVEPARLTIHTRQGEELTVGTQEDFTEKVAIGSPVTAWYVSKDAGNTLQWLNYPLENFFQPINAIEGRIKKVIILLSSSVPEGGALVDSMSDYLKARLGWYVAPRVLAEELRDRAKKSDSTLEVIDPTTGAFDLSKYKESYHQLMARLASESRVDAVLQADVVKVKAPFYAQIAIWDGVEEPIASKTSRTLTAIAGMRPEGEIQASTLVLKLWDRQGTLVWSQRQGFAVLGQQVGMGDRFRERPLSEVLQNPQKVEKWFDLVWHSFLPHPVARPTTSPGPSRTGE